MSIKIQGSILIVDDMMMVRRTIVKYFKEMGFEKCIEGGSGREAYEKLNASTESVPVAIIDWTMPDGGGIDLLTRIKGEAKYKDMKIIMMMLDAEKENFKTAQAKGANHLLVKPFSVPQFQEVLKKAGMA